ncbi:hypothetical protein D1007_25983 [Hordeum vulgare]|nr:hypothetical protein D1007_25983 [Hordeum vulgare]
MRWTADRRREGHHRSLCNADWSTTPIPSPLVLFSTLPAAAAAAPRIPAVGFLRHPADLTGRRLPSRSHTPPSAPGLAVPVEQPGKAAAAAADDDVWGDASDSPGHDSNLKREWEHRQEQFHKMGYRDGITEGQKDIAQEGFNLGHRQSVHVGYKWGLVRGITSALASLPDTQKEKLLFDAQRRGKLEDLHKSVKEISAEGALRLFHESILQDNHQAEESKLQTIPKDLLLLLQECPDVQVSEELKRVPQKMIDSFASAGSAKAFKSAQLEGLIDFSKLLCPTAVNVMLTAAC